MLRTEVGVQSNIYTMDTLFTLVCRQIEDQNICFPPFVNL